VPDLTLTNGSHRENCKIHIKSAFPSFYAVQLAAAGSLYFQRGANEVVTINQPTFFWTDRTSRYSYGPTNKGGWDHNWVTFIGDSADTYYRPVLEALAPAGYCRVTNLVDIQQAFDTLVALAKSSVNDLSCLHQLNELLALVDSGRCPPHQANDGIQRIKQRIDESPNRKFDLRELASSEAYSYSNFRRLFFIRFGIPPHRYVLRRRMQTAAQMLMQEPLNVQEVALKMGYDDPAQFSKVFKLHNGVSPAYYRRASLSYYQKPQTR